MPTVAALNTLDQSRFTATLGHLFEHSPWVADETWTRRPFRDETDLHRALCATLRAAPQDRKHQLICAHPDLAGRLGHEAQLTVASAHEQAAAGLDRLGAAEREEFQRLNAAYRERFGFPFIICARLNDRSAILAAMRHRLNRAPAEEFDTALAEIEKIAALRLHAVLER